ncbi:hypothetical protein F6X40_10470 [Paraburkholderia sp. UCT31]|uniref:hypothetical protein n=1 Tax=Paraburkholderia sp. UCT31 TaxID=2615209 RepID=UPI0016557240|nr:hypothetical protein [Paraburkholderia sp. UCT31]MBC8737231.1 hypothetical protein [Paraburkholderia sp. UCT31]
MIRHLFARGFKAVPYLETSLLMQTHAEGVAFSEDKPNVIVGPNGAGKSALLTALSLQTLTYFSGVSSFDENYTTGVDAGGFWEQVGSRWSNDYRFLPGLTCDTDKGPAMYYRPHHIPGNDNDVTTAMMCGYSKQARAYEEKVRHKSAGQQSQALLEKLNDVLDGDVSGVRYQYINWRHGREVCEFERGRYVCDFEYQAEILKREFGNVAGDAKPVLILDEPEQSLDARAEAVMWGKIAKVDTARVQVIIATHSLYPLMHPEKFHIIEAVPEYVKEVQALL